MDNDITVKKRYWWWAIIILSVVLLRLPSFATPFLNIDENEYAIAGLKILEGGLPYRDFLIYQPPVIYYFYALSFWFFGAMSFAGVHAMLILWVMASAWMVYKVAKEMFGSEMSGLYSALFYALVSAAFIPQDMLAANCEIIAVLPTLIAIWLYIKGERTGNLCLLFVSGIFIGVTALTKYQCGIVLLPLLIVLLFVHRRFFQSFVFLAGFAASIALTAFLLWKAGVWQETLDGWEYITKYAKGPPQSELLYVAIKFAVRTALIALAGLGVWYMAIRGAVVNIESRALLVLWFIFGFLPVVVGGRMYFHYYFVVLPPLCILAGAYLVEHGMKKWLKVVFIAWGLICVTGFFIYNTWKPHSRPTVKEDWKFAVSYLVEHSSSSDSLFVWGNSPQIYSMSGLNPATRFTTADYLTGKTPATAGMEYDPLTSNPPSSWQKVKNDFIDPPGIVIFDTSKNVFPKAWDYLREDLTKGLPTFIVDTAPSNYRRYGRYPVENYPFLAKILSDNYRLEADVKGYRIFKLR